MKGHGKGKYRGVRQETFITNEAKKVLIEYRAWMEKTFNHKWSNEDYVFLSIKRNISEPLSMRMIAKKATVLEQRANVNFTFHDGRRIVQTALENAGCSINWIKKIKGRKVSGEEAPYSHPLIEQLRAKYKDALPDLEFLSEGVRVVDETKLNELELKVKELTGQVEKWQTNAITEKLTLDILLSKLSNNGKIKINREGLERAIEEELDRHENEPEGYPPED